MACCLLILLWVQDEVETDRLHENVDQIYLVGSLTKYGIERSYSWNTPAAIGPALKADFPEVVKFSRFNNSGSVIVGNGENSFFENCLTVDPDFIDMFSFTILGGNKSKLLDDPFSIVLSETMAAKYFEGVDPIGKVLTINSNLTFTVTGIIEDAPKSSSIQYSCLIPFIALEKIWNSPDYSKAWGNWNLKTYVQIHPGSIVADLDEKIRMRLSEGTNNPDDRIFLSSFARMHLYGFRGYGGRIGLVIILVMIAMMIMGIACLNFMNLSTARSAMRAKEVGLRKVTGAFSSDIMKQFYVESFLFAFISLLISLALVEVLMPSFNAISGKSLQFSFSARPELLFSVIGIIIVTGLFAGSYPAFFMSRFNPVKIFSNLPGTGHRKKGFRRGFVIWQFTLSIILAITTLTLYKQIDHMKTMDLGIVHSDIAYIYMNGELKEQSETLKHEILMHPGVKSASLASRLPTGIYTNGSGWRWEGRAPGVDPLVTYYAVDPDFLNTMQAEVVRGEFYSDKHAGGTSLTHGGVVINEKMAQIIGKDNPVGTQISNYGNPYTVIGVVKNFNFKPASQRIGPLLLFHQAFSTSNPNRYQYLLVKLQPDFSGETLADLDAICNLVSPGYPASVTLLHDAYNSLYSSMNKSASIIKYGASFMIFVSCLGLFGLAAFVAEQRTKEIGIRKILGASINSIYKLLCKDMLIPVVIANAIAWVVSFLLLNTWLEAKFAFNTSIGIMPFLIAGLVSLGIAFIAISIHLIRAAASRPIDAVRHE